ncbi:hypothetical protein ASPZODRAFT_135530 [Penicilliopsis zonata CBS 506.65]|uniref:Calcium uniporter protein n=1 Tax=Penicilliopsis zonata CBS 506.65 TaxID=1073090 RepID=A0A1L9SA96_9EURO|nr:hypothetical protein ASPZODRAFT_135530 [Penicilliopsis zonata CBS 506.65]OJJ44078.1 hypothetical protein ASPZODRAFT_135530 [Penicilliopsis zonata CBS 506.65]
MIARTLRSVVPRSQQRVSQSIRETIRWRYGCNQRWYTPSPFWQGVKEHPVEGAGKDSIKGKLLTTPSRLFKLIVPISSLHKQNNEPIALLVHPQQPLSYLERLVQAEVPPIKEDGQQRPPGVSFLALQMENDAIRPRKYENSSKDKYTHKEQQRQQQQQQKQKEEAELVRWSPATEIGDFIRDAARAREFLLQIEGDGRVCVEVPSFSERTYFLRMRLRKLSRRLQALATTKHECDVLAHRGAQRVALGGFGILASWWYLVYRLTFETELGWDTMEPVTYLVSLSTLMGGYLWFLYHNREISYRSALDLTISTRQKRLYAMRGVDLTLWASLIDEGNALRREIKTIAGDYDVEWDERQDEQDERVIEALKEGEKKEKKDAKESEEQDS